MKRVLTLSALLLLLGGGTMGARAQDPTDVLPDAEFLGPDLEEMGVPGGWGAGPEFTAAGDRDFPGGPAPGMRGHRPGRWGRPGLGLHQRLAGLDLTQDQKDRIAGIHDAHARAMIQSRADLRIARLELGKLLRSETPDERAIDAQIDRIASIRAAMAKSRVGAHLELRSILTEEQRAKLHGSRPRAGRGESDRSPRRDRRRP